MDLIFRNLFFCQHWFLRIQIPVILTSFNTSIPGTYSLGYARCAGYFFQQIVRSIENQKKDLMIIMDV